MNQEFTGNILFNNYDIMALDLYKIRENLFGIVEQEPELVTTNISKNLTFGLNKFNRDNINTICEKIGIPKIQEDESSKPTSVSGGEKQKITLTRVILKSPNILVLDEPTSAMDTFGKEYLMSYLQTNKSNRIIVIVTHDVELQKIADKIIYF